MLYSKPQFVNLLGPRSKYGIHRVKLQRPFLHTEIHPTAPVTAERKSKCWKQRLSVPRSYGGTAGRGTAEWHQSLQFTSVDGEHAGTPLGLGRKVLLATGYNSLLENSEQHH